MHEIRMELGFGQRLPYLAAGCGLTALGIVSIVFDSTPTSLFPGVAMLVMFFVSARWGAVLTPYGLTAKGLTTRHFAWPEIAMVEVSRFLGTQTVRLTLANGKRTRLRAPVSGWGAQDAHFPMKAYTIWQWWAAGSGRVAQPDGPVPPLWQQPQAVPPQQQWPGGQGWPQAPAGQPPYGPPGP
ncbi:hypothetical protein LO772_11720 [Yinghuangia sp. ASG 101]|uniref:hypothetical protein n=1 Tax=Yinghuangia sp. ASG 101 TaxID=2896848 RepID=UPI001E5E0849|nr:hypothetical protein [Yinghuangia sp. ASG 101]UGQ14195.1 hypothetical protein LO772_11720 [Yinghuangia sp. ASG 101]